MSTIKSDSIQPTSTSNNLILRTGVGDVERMRITTAGGVNMYSTLSVEGAATIQSVTVGCGGGNISTNTANGFQALYSNTTGSNNTANGFQALYNNSTGSSNTANGYAALYNNTGSNNTANGYAALYNNTGSNNTCIGNGANTSTTNISNQVVLGNGAISAFRCQVALTVVSDERDKTNIIDIPVGLNLISKIRPVSFEWNQRDGNRIGRKEFGFTAQQLQTAQTEIGIEVPYLVNNDNLENLAVSPTQLISVLVKAIQELKAELEAAKLRITQLENIP